MSALTHDDMLRMVREAWQGGYTSGYNDGAQDGARTEREACGKARAGAPRDLPRVGTGGLLGEQQYCFNKGWREGAAAVRAAIRARGQKGGA